MKTKERIKNIGEVFTPNFIVEEMLDSIPQNVLCDPEKTILEPTCGEGVFILSVIKRRIKSGVDIEKAISSIYGLDIMEDNILVCKNKIYKLACNEIYNQYQQKKISKKQAVEKSKRITVIIDHNIRLTKDMLKEDIESMWPTT